MSHEIKLPPLPTGRVMGTYSGGAGGRVSLYMHSDEDMKSYATAAVEQDRAQRVASVDEIMSQAQVMASAWSLVGGRFDTGGAMQDFEEAKAELREMLSASTAPLSESEIQDLRSRAVGMLEKSFPATARPERQPELTTCNCRWAGETQVQQCTLHEAHVDAIHEWAERAKSAEKKLSDISAQPERQPPEGSDRAVAIAKLLDQAYKRGLAVGVSQPERQPPAWHDAPTCEGIWICNEQETSPYRWSAIRVTDPLASSLTDDRYPERWFGPIPEDKP